MTRKPMTFSVDQPARAPAEPPTPVSPADEVERQQVGARVPKATYRQLKARAALTGKTVQELVERAINEFLVKPVKNGDA